jgi:hypothetical protein
MIERTYYCDRSGCGLNGPEDEFHTVREMKNGPERHFCSWTCLRDFSAQLLEKANSQSQGCGLLAR